MVNQLNGEQFSAIIAGKDITIVDFFASWCGPCKMMHPVLEQISQDNRQINFYQINIDDEQELAITNGVQVVPTFIAYKNGAEVGRLIGYNSPAEFQKFLDNLQ